MKSLTDPETSFIEYIVNGLQRRSITTCSQWALKYRQMGSPFPGPFTFRYHPWEREMHDSLHDFNVGQKGAQVGFTDTVLNIAFFSLDVKGKDVLYVLPTSTDATDFTAGRFNPALELSTHLARLFSEVSNVGHKRAGTRNLYVRGSRSRSKLKSIPIGRLILDEVDEMTQDNIPLAMERLSGQMDTLTWMLSTPTVPDYGINQYYKASTQDNFFFPCPCCSRSIRLTFPDSIIITADDPNDPKVNDSHLICTECHNRLHHFNKYEWLAPGKWVSAYPYALTKGWHISQLYSSAKAAAPNEIAKLYLRSLTDPADAQEFYNSKLGITFEVDGSKLNDRIIRACIGNYLQEPKPQKLVTMGVDQGAWCHYEVAAWDVQYSNDLSNTCRPQITEIGKVRDFEELDKVMVNNGVNYCVLDAHPERRKANEFANRFPGIVRLCFYPEGMLPKQITTSDASNEPLVSVDRTSWLDTSLGRFYHQRISLPGDTPHEYVEHLKAISRVYKKDKNGNPIGRYVTGSRPDHYAHARNYNEIALHLALNIGHAHNIVDTVY